MMSFILSVTVWVYSVSQSRDWESKGEIGWNHY